MTSASSVNNTTNAHMSCHISVIAHPWYTPSNTSHDIGATRLSSHLKMVMYVARTRQVRQHSGLSTWHTRLRGQACGTCAKWERAHRSLIRRPMMRRRADREVEEPTRPPPSDIRTDADRRAHHRIHIMTRRQEAPQNASSGGKFRCRQGQARGPCRPTCERQARATRRRRSDRSHFSAAQPNVARQL